MRRRLWVGMMIVLGTMLCSGCLMGPTDGQVVAAKDAEVSVVGYVLQPSQETFAVYAFNRTTGRWDQFSTVSLNHNVTEQLGDQQWVGFERTVTLPQEDAYWGFAADGKPEIRIKVHGDRESDANSLFTFPKGAETCMLETLDQTNSPLAVIEQCSQGQSARVRARCGEAGEACCRNGCNHETDFCSSRDGLCWHPVTSSPYPTVTGGSGGGDEDGCVGEGGSCTVHPSECARSPGFTASGTWECKRGEAVCVPDTSTYCSVCGGPCGACQLCSATNLCAPGATCINGQCRNVIDCAPSFGETGVCWNFSDVGSCHLDGAPVNFCLYRGVSYAPGETFPAADGCNSCTCQENGQESCTTNSCS